MYVFSCQTWRSGVWSTRQQAEPASAVAPEVWQTGRLGGRQAAGPEGAARLSGNHVVWWNEETADHHRGTDRARFCSYLIHGSGPRDRDFGE